MGFLYSVPKWFLGFDLAFEILFGLITLLAAFYSLKIYRLCRQKEFFLLSAAFTSLAMSYFTFPILNALLPNSSYSFVLISGMYLYIIFFLVGLSTLAYLTFNSDNYRLYALITSLSIVTVIFSSQAILAFNFVSAVLLFYACLYYGSRCARKTNKNSFLILGAFILLFFARVGFVFATINRIPYVAGHLIEFSAYIIIAIALARTFGMRRK